MKLSSIVTAVFGLIMTIMLIACFVSWYRGGAKIPRWVHGLALTLSICGVAAVALLRFDGSLTPQLAFSCLLIPPAAAYVGWFWMFGPWARH